MSADGLWGDRGQCYSWDALSGLTPQQECNVVIQLACLEPYQGSALGVIFPNNCNVRVKGLVDIKQSTQSITLLDVRYEGVDRIPTFQVTASTVIVQHSPVRVASLYNLVELCAGVGIATTGLDFVGLKTKLAVELRAPFADVFASLNPDATVLTGDINDPACLRQILVLAPSSSTLVAGFNCQPYSKAGSMKGIHDERAESLQGVLKVAFYLRSPIVVLECVVEAASNRHVQAELSRFCTQCGYNISEVTLRLEDVWPCRRERWWVVMSACALGKIDLRPLPVQPFPACIKHVLPRPLQLSEDDVRQLQLQGNELQRFLKFRPDLQSMMLSLQGKCPTLLHSIGSQVTECMCGCRCQGFADATLASKGLFGILMPVARPDFKIDSHELQVRHPHPNELALLSAIEPKQDWKCPHRLALAGIGQQANPVHALWIGAQIIAHLEFVITGVRTASPRRVLDSYISMMLDWCRGAPLVPLHDEALAEDDSIPVPSAPSLEVVAPEDVDMPETPCIPDGPMNDFAALPTSHVGDATSCTLISVHNGAQVQIAVSHLATVGDLIVAEANIQGSTNLIEVIDPLSQEVLEASRLVQGRCLWVRSFPVPSEPLPTEASGPCQPIEQVVSPTLHFEVDVADQKSDEAQRVEVDNHLAAAVGCVPDPLLSLNEQQLTELAPPVVSCTRNLDALLTQTITNEVRSDLLTNQGDLWADDEIRWHLWQITDRSTKPDVVVLDPLVATHAARSPSVGLLGSWFKQIAFTPKVIVSAVCIDAHWSPMIWTWTPECLMAHSWDLPGLIPNTKCLNDALSKVVGARTFTARVLHRMDGTSTGCGVCAVRYVDHFLTGRMLPTSRDDIDYLHGVAKDLFRKHAQHATHLIRPWCWGNGLDSQAQARLCDILKQHGVPLELLDQRAHLITQAIGVPPLQKCLTGSAPWRSLKALANQCQPMLQLVLPDELKAVVEAKAVTGSTNRKSKGKQPVAKSTPAKPPPLDPTKLTFDAGAFVTDLGAPLTAIPVSQLGPLAEGVAIAALSDVEPFLRSGKVISKNCLGVFLVNIDDSTFETGLVWAQTRVALRCIANGEPMLLSGYLVQLGAKHAIQARTKHVVEVQSLPAACLKIAVYRDGIIGNWDDVVNAPIRYILQHLEPLASCNQSADKCSCSKWHVDNSTGVKDAIFDLWRRQWLSTSMKVASPMQADLFMVNVRYAKVLELKVLQLSGLAGIYLEPRTLDARETVPDFQVLWMAKQTLAELVHLKQCNPGVIGLARLGARSGLRIRAEDMSTIGKALKPDAIWLGGGPRMDFEVGPVPYGLDRSGLARLCQEWGWTAKPINPTKAISGLGTVWQVQSCMDPPSTVVSLKGGADVVISKMAPKVSQIATPSSTVASAETIGLCKLQPSDLSPDPWLVKDPWSQAASKVAAIKSPPIDLEASLKQVEQRIERAVLAKLPSRAGGGDGDQDMDVGQDDTKARLHELESQVSRLTSGQSMLEQRIDEAGKKSDAQISQLQHQMTAQLEGQGTRIEDLFRGQMQQIESLLNKKARFE